MFKLIELSQEWTQTQSNLVQYWSLSFDGQSEQYRYVLQFL